MPNLFKNLFNRVFSKKIAKDENDKNVKWFLESYYEEINCDINSLQIHYIEVKTKNTIEIEITLGRPGLLIGKAGRTINEIESRLSDWLEKPTKIKIIEFNALR